MRWSNCAKERRSAELLNLTANDRMTFGDLANVITKRLSNHAKAPLKLFDLLLLHRLILLKD
jgi:hypothetical protein